MDSCSFSMAPYLFSSFLERSNTNILSLSARPRISNCALNPHLSVTANSFTWMHHAGVCVCICYYALRERSGESEKKSNICQYIHHNSCEPIKQRTDSCILSHACTGYMWPVSKTFSAVKDKLHMTECELVFDIGAGRHLAIIRSWWHSAMAWHASCMCLVENELQIEHSYSAFQPCHGNYVRSP